MRHRSDRPYAHPAGSGGGHSPQVRAPEREVPFDEPWQARVFALTEGVLATTGVGREAFRQRLIEAIAEQPERPYWESWLVALERLVDDLEASPRPA